MGTSDEKFLTLRGRKIRIDAEGRVCLTDIHRAGGFSVNQTPGQWARLGDTVRLMAVTLQNVGKSHIKGKITTKSIYYAERGKGKAAWAHPVLALAYAKYLSPTLHYEVNEVYLRYKAGDATLADETLQRSSDEGNEWAGVRAMGRVKRNKYTDTLKDHGVVKFGFANCTDATYRQILGGPAKVIRQTRNLPEKANLRDHMDTDELIYVMAAEALATGRIRDEESYGNKACIAATARSASFIRQAIDADKADRRKPSA